MKKKSFILNKINYLSLHILLSYIFLVKSLLEIPFQAIEIRDTQRYKYFKFKENFENQTIYKLNEVYTTREGPMQLGMTNLIFLTNIKIGSNKQNFNLVLDTGSAHLWVAKKGSIDGYDITNHYNPSDSSTSYKTNEKFELNYGDKTFSFTYGYYYEDNINFINDINFKMKFGVADYTHFNVKDADGVIGLAHYYKDESFSFIHMLNESKITDSISFSFKFDAAPDKKSFIGKLIIGKHNDFESSNTVTCPLLTLEEDYNHFWSCEISGFGLNNSYNEIKSTKKFSNFIFDSGTNIMVLPLDYLNDIENELYKINCTKKKEVNGRFSLQCLSESLPNLKLNISGNIFIIPKKLIFNKDFSSRFYFSETHFYIIGSSFFITFHTLFDKENEKLHFYSPIRQYIERKTETTDKNEIEIEPVDKDKNKEKTVDNSSNQGGNPLIALIIISIIVIVGVLVGIFIFYFIKNKKKNSEFELIPNCDYNINNQDEEENDNI